MERARRRSKPLTPAEKTYRILLPLLFGAALIGLTGMACGGNGGVKCQDGKPPFKVNGTCPETPAFDFSNPVFYV